MAVEDLHHCSNKRTEFGSVRYLIAGLRPGLTTVSQLIHLGYSGSHQLIKTLEESGT